MTLISTQDSRDELEIPNDRISRLAREKSYLQLIINLINKIISASGLDNITDSILQAVLNVIGGTNLALYYRIDNGLHYVDISGEKKLLEECDDELVKTVFTTGNRVEQKRGFSETKMQTPEFSSAYTWVYPLKIGADVIGVLKIENLHISTQVISPHLHTLFSYIAMALRNEIMGQSRLQKAYDELAQEVAERRKAEAELRRSQELLEARVRERTADLNLASESLRKSHDAYNCILETTSDGFWHVDTTGRLLNVNASYAGQSGYSLEELLAMQITDLEIVESRAETAEHMRHVISTGSDLFETRHRRKDGLVWDVEVSCSYLNVEDGQILAFLRDISGRKQAEEALRESTERFSVAFNNAPIMITISDLEDGKFLDVNQQFMTVSGFSREEVIDRTSIAVGWVSAEDREKLKEMMLERGKIHEHDITFHTKSGKSVFCKYWGEIITVSGQKRLLSIALDMTEHRKIEQQFLQAQKMESVGRLAGGVAHDFNNMLGVIIGHAELALMHADPSNPLRHDLEAILDAANRSADITRQLLAFARQQTSIPKVQDLNETVFGMLKMLRRLIGEDIELSWKPGYELWKVKIDPTQLDQILANLCVNARDAIAGVGAIEIRTENSVIEESEYSDHAEMSPGEYVLLTVSDNGSGMGKDVIEHIFEPFYTTKELGHGTGLGLATVFGIVKQNGGHIKVYSEPGHGTVFKIYLHAEKSAAENNTLKIQPIVGGDETILIVEDEPAILNMATSMLAKLGYRVLSANSSEEAQRLATEHQGRINLLVTDIIMPGMNGRDLAELLQKSNPEMKCLFMSGYTADVMSDRGNIGENVHFLQKPFNVQSLAEKVREAL